jgi:hypothetical protein
MEERTVISFLTLKDLRASAIAAKLQSVCETEALLISSVKEWRKPFAEGRTSSYDDPKCGRPITNGFAEAISFILKERPCLSCRVLCRHFRIAKGTCLRILQDMLGMKSFIFVGFHTLGTYQKTERVTLSHGILSVLQSPRFSSFQRVIIGDESWFCMDYPRNSIWASSPDKIPEGLSQKAQKSVSFHFFGLRMESTALLTFRKAAYIIRHSFAILLYQGCLTELLYIPEENHSKVCPSTWTMAASFSWSYASPRSNAKRCVHYQ